MRNRRGMTLVEVIVAMAIFAVVMVTVFTAFIITNVMNNVSKEFSDASYQAQNEMEVVYGLSREKALDEVLIDLGAAYGYTCSGMLCEKTVGNFDYELNFAAHPSVSRITIITIIVEATTGDYAGDRAKIENYVRFHEGG